MVDRTGQNAIQALSNGGTRETGPAVIPGGFKFHAGHYAHISKTRWDSTFQAKVFSVIDSIAGDDEVKGIQLMLYPIFFENAKDDFTSGINTVKAILNKLDQVSPKKRLMLCNFDRTFGTATGTVPSNVYPPYWVSNGYIKAAPAGSNWSGSLSSIPLLDTAMVMDRLISISQAYGEEFDGHPLLEMWAPMGESSTGSAGLSVPGLVTQFERLMTATRTSWPTTPQRFMLNFLNDSATVASILAYARGVGGIAVGGPDPEIMNTGAGVPTPLPANYPTNVNTITAAYVFRGLSKPDSTHVVPTYTDMRLIMPWCLEIQGSCATILPADYIAYERTTMHAWHIVHLYNDWLPSGSNSSDPHRWAAIRAAIHAVAGATNTGVPSEGSWNTA